ncbi:MAG: epimerase [Gemmatimonadota bacterium]
MRVIIFGATGMVGAGALLECIEDARVTSILLVGRSTAGVGHPKVRELLHTDFFDYSRIQSEFASHDACFFCLGVSSARLTEPEYRHLTYDLTLAAATALCAASPHLVFCYISGLGTDSSGTGRVMWARVKGQTENALLALPFRASYMFRPGFIQPLKGVRSKTRWYQLFYDALKPVAPILRRWFPAQVTTTVRLGRALIAVAADGYERRIVNTRDINLVGGDETEGTA